MSYVPNTEADRAEMLRAIGVEKVEDLFHDVPEECRFPVVELPDPVSEPEVMSELTELSEYNVATTNVPCFLGAGAYRHFVPSVVNHIISRSEFYTAYTPYQPEISQGTLQSIFEYQSMICALTGMDVANASHYDGATGLAEAAVMAANATRGNRTKVLLSPGVHPEYRAVVRAYLQGTDLVVAGDETADLNLAQLVAAIDAQTVCVVVQNPDFFGYMGDMAALKQLADAAHAAGALFVVTANPISLGLFAPPSEYGADIVCGEGQALGGGLNFGGPYLGFFACKNQYVHKMAGRIVGQTVDANGERGFVLTLSAREQHIRREKATSNICSNEALMALAAAVYMSCMGKNGLRQIAELCYQKAHYAASQLATVPGYRVRTDQVFFHEFVLECPRPAADVNDYLLNERGIIGGYDLGQDYAALSNAMVICCTEMTTKDDIDILVDELRALEEQA